MVKLKQVKEILKGIDEGLLEHANQKKIFEDKLKEIDDVISADKLKKNYVISRHLSEKYNCDCSGLYSLYNLYVNTHWKNTFEPMHIRNTLLKGKNIHTYNNEIISDLLKSGVLFESAGWMDEFGDIHQIDSETQKDLVKNKNFNPVTGDEYSPELETWCDDSQSYILMGQWVLNQIVPLLHFNEDVILYIENLIN